MSIGTADLVHVLDPVDHADAIRRRWAPRPSWCCHNTPFDVPILLRRRADAPRGRGRVYDTLVTARLAHPSERVSKSLGEACERHLGQDYGALKYALETGLPGHRREVESADVRASSGWTRRRSSTTPPSTW